MGGRNTSWYITSKDISSASIIYSFGLGEDVTFETELIEKYGVTVHAFDPTPKSINFVNALNLPNQFILHQIGISDHDGFANFFPPENPLWVSHSIIPRSKSIETEIIKVPVSKLSTIMNNLGHKKIDLLKMDIEGAEYCVIEDLINTNLSISQLCLEFHHRWPEIGVEKTKKAVSSLNDYGFQIFYVSPNGLEYSFIKSK
jgi:FkbM family methyltransferase